MSKWLSFQLGDWDGNNWYRQTAESALHALTNITISGATPQYSAVFTAPNLINAATAVTPIVVNYSGAGNFVATLQEYNGAAWNDTTAIATYNFTDLTINAINHLQVVTPYVFTTITAGYYRWKFAQTGTNVIVASDGAGTVARGTWDNRTGYPVAGDDVIIAAPTSTRTRIKVVGTEACGGALVPSTSISYRTFSAALYVADYGSFECDTAASSKLAIKGHTFIGRNAYFETDLDALPSITYTHETEHSTADGDFGITIGDAPLLINISGAPRTNWKPLYVSGNGTTGSELQVAEITLDWLVGDKLVITPTDVYNHLEVKFIKTIAAGLITLCDTPGGAESGLSWTHTTRAKVFNCHRNIQFTAKNASYGYYFINSNTISTASITIDWALFLNPGGTTILRRGVQIKSAANHYLTSFDYNVCWSPVSGWGLNSSSSKITQSYDGLIQYGGNYIIIATYNETFNSPVALATAQIGFNIINTGVVLNDPMAYGCNTSGFTYWGGMLLSNARVQMIGGDIQCNRYNTISLSSTYDCRITSAYFGDVAAPTSDIYVATGTFNQIVFDSCYFYNATPTVGGTYSDNVDGTKIRFHRWNATDNKHYVYTPGGIIQSTGASLADTNVHTAGSLALRLTPNNVSNGIYWEYKVPCFVGYSAEANGFIQKNAAMASDETRVELWMPQSTSADQVEYMPSDSNWNVFSLGQAYSGSVPAYATIKIYGLSVAVGAYVYVDDLFDGTDEINGLDLWEDALPSEIILSEVGNPQAVWAVQTSILTTSGTIGRFVTKLLSVAKFLGLK